MKKILIVLFICHSAFIASSQSINSDSNAVEIIVKLVQRSDGKTIKNLAVAVSIVNHSNKNLYIPGGFLLKKFEKENDTWHMLDLFDNKIDTAFEGFYHPVMEYNKENFEWYQKHWFNTEKWVKETDSIKQKYLSIDKQFIKFKDDLFLFLKANETLENFYFLGIEKFLKRNTSFKMNIIHNKYDSNNLSSYPAKILDYELYDPKKVKSNTIYYTVEPL